LFPLATQPKEATIHRSGKKRGEKQRENLSQRKLKKLENEKNKICAEDEEEEEEVPSFQPHQAEETT
jgi:hypothetical protein